MILTANVYLVPRLGTSGAIPPPYIFMTRTGETLPFCVCVCVCVCVCRMFILLSQVTLVCVWVQNIYVATAGDTGVRLCRTSADHSAMLPCSCVLSPAVPVPLCSGWHRCPFVLPAYTVGHQSSKRIGTEDVRLIKLFGFSDMHENIIIKYCNWFGKWCGKW